VPVVGRVFPIAARWATRAAQPRRNFARF